MATANERKTYLVRHLDLCPDLDVERGPHGRGVGSWVPEQKHRLLADYIEATSGARRRWPHRVFLDLFAGPSRIQVEGESFTRDGGAMVAWRQSARLPASQFTHVIVGDLDADRVAASVARLRAAGAPVQGLTGPAAQTCAQALALVPRNALCLAYLDPYNLQHLSFEIIRQLSALPKVDFAVHFSTMDLMRNVEIELTRARFDDAAPGWREAIDPMQFNKQGLREAVFDYWCRLVQGLDFKFSQRMPLIKNDANKPLYRLVFFSRNAFPNAIWDEVARGSTGDLFS